MKDAEDEAFDELAKRQGDWGGGFPAKRKMAADKQEPWNEDEWRRNNWRCGHGWLRGEQCEICNAAQPAQEPVAWMLEQGAHIEFERMDYHNGDEWTPLYTAPPQREWVGLTDDALADLWYKESLDWMEFARAVEQLLKEKNT